MMILVKSSCYITGQEIFTMEEKILPVGSDTINPKHRR